MDRESLLVKVSELLGEIVENDNLKLNADTKADDVKDWDSTNHVRLLVAIESEFAIRFETSEIGGLENVGQLIDLVQSKLIPA